MKKLIGIFIILLFMGCQFSNTPDAIIHQDGITYGLYPDTGITNLYLKKEIPQGLMDQLKVLDE